MKTRALAALLALPLLAFDCGGDEPEPTPVPTSCTLQIRGAASEDLWCIVAAFDYSDLDPGNPLWGFELVAYRGMTEVGAGVGLFLEGRPALGVPYGWTATTSTVDSGGAERWVGDLGVGDAVMTHEAAAPMLVDDGVGALSVTFSRIPPPGATEQQTIDVHGTLGGTLPAVDGLGAPVTFAATF